MSVNFVSNNSNSDSGEVQRNRVSLSKVLKLGFVGTLLAAAGKASYDYLTPSATCPVPQIKNKFTYAMCPEIFPETPQKFIRSLGFDCNNEIQLANVIDKKIYKGEGADVCRLLAACPKEDKLIAFRNLMYEGDLESVRFLVENGIVDPSRCEYTFHDAVAIKNPAFFKFLLPYANEKTTKTALIKAASLGKLAFIKSIVFRPIDVSAAIPSALLEAAKNGHLSSVKFLAKNQNIDINHIEEAFLASAQAGQSHVIRYLCKEYVISQDVLNKALEKTAFLKKKETFIALVQGGANFFSSGVSADYGSEIGMLPNEEEIFSLPSDHQFKFFVAYINKQEMSPSMFKVFQSVLSRMNGEQQGVLLENLLAHQMLSDERMQWVVDRMPDLSVEFQFRLARLALLKGSSYESFRSCLNEKQKNALKKLEGRVANQRREAEELKASILRADRALALRPSREEWQEEVERQIGPRFDRIVALARKEIREGIHVYKDFAQQIYVASLEEFPGLIFKIFPKNREEHKEQYERATKALEVCKKDGLNRLRVPYSLERLIEVDDQYVSIEERLDVLDDCTDYRSRVQFMSSDPELSKILSETFRQATIFISRTGWYDTRFNNGPLLKDGTGMGLVDIDRMGAHPVTGLYRFQEESALIDSVHDPEIIKATVREMDQDRFRDFDFGLHEAGRRKILARQKRQREVLLKKGLLDNDPIPTDPSLLQGLSPLEAKAARGLIKMMNEKLENKDYDGEPRGVHINLSSFFGQPEFRDDEAYYKKGVFDFSIFKRVIDHFQQNEVVFYAQPYGFDQYKKVLI